MTAVRIIAASILAGFGLSGVAVIKGFLVACNKRHAPAHYRAQLSEFLAQLQSAS